jgi:hypothetical protein
MMDKLRTMVDGRKTYFIAAGMVVISGLRAQGYIDDNTYATLLGLLNGAGFAALRAGLAKK